MGFAVRSFVAHIFHPIMKTRITVALAAIFTLFLSSANLFGQQGAGVGIDVTNPLEKLDVNGAIKIGTDINNSNAAPTGGAGTIRFKAGAFQGWDGTSWIPLGGGADSDWTINGNNQYSAVSGNVGIGVTNPTDKLQVNGRARFLNDDLILTNNAQSFILRANEGSNYIQLDVGGGGHASDNFYIGDLTTANNEVYMMGAVGIGNDNPGEKLDVTGSIRMQDGNQAAGFIPVSDANGTMTWTDPATITTASDDDWATTGNNISNANTGNVGVGTATPDRLLNIESATGPQMLFTRNDNSTTDGELMGELLFDNNDDTAPSSVDAAVVIRANASGNQGNSNKGGSLSILTKNNANGSANATERMRIAANGNVGIGTTTPAQKLDVAGKIQMQTGATAGFIPVSDANGTMTWTNPTTITTAADGDGSSTNELQTLSQTGTNVTLSNGGGTISVADNDNSVSNELQTLNISGNDITLSNGGGTISIPDDADWTINGNDIHNANTGNVGIGIATPNYEMGIHDPTNANTWLQFTHSASGTTPGDGFIIGLDGNSDAKLLLRENQNMIFSTNNTERMRVTETGKVGINSANPFAHLHIYNPVGLTDASTVDQYSMLFESDASEHTGIGFISYLNNDPTKTPGAAIVYDPFSNIASRGWLRFKTIKPNNASSPLSTTMVLDERGYVGIGTDDPLTSLHVYRDTVASDDGRVRSYQMVLGGRSAVGSETGLAFVGNPQSLGASPGVAITYEVEGSFSSDYGKLHFKTKSAATTTSSTPLVKRMTIARDGNVGIGTTNPAQLLDVQGSIQMADGNQQTGYIPVSDANGTMVWTDPTTIATDDDWTVSGNDIYNANTGNVGVGTANPTSKFEVNGDIEISGSRLHVGSNGNVGVGTSSPSSKLEVDGDIEISGSRLHVNSNGNVGVGTSSPSSKFEVNGDVEISGSRLHVGSNDRVGIGTASPSNPLEVNGGASGDNSYVVNIENTQTDASNSTRYNGMRIEAGKTSNNNADSRMISFIRPDNTFIGSIFQNNASTVNYSTSSDIRLKKNIQPTHFSLNDLMAIEVKDYAYKTDPEEIPMTGFLAQQLHSVYPISVHEGGEDPIEDPWMVDYGQVTPLLVKAVQDLKAEKDQLETLVETLLQRVEQLEQH